MVSLFKNMMVQKIAVRKRDAFLDGAVVVMEGSRSLEEH